jgi:hypothetical protein
VSRIKSILSSIKSFSMSDGSGDIVTGVILAVTVVVGLGMSFFDSSDPPSSSSSASSTPTKKYCKYEGCTDSPSQFWEAGTGFCGRHAQQLRNQEKLIDKLKTEGY